MKTHTLCTLLFVLLVRGLAAADAEARLKVLIITGGHGFEREPFLKMFQDDPGIAFTEAKHEKNCDAYERGDLLDQDVVVLYDMVKDATETQRARLLSLFEKGVGLVVLHHALVSHQHWPEYERIIGGRYPEPDGKGGVVTAEVGYQHDVDIPIVIADKDHPITSGMQDFTLHDEIYWGFRVGSDVTPLITTTHPRSGKTLGWTRSEGKSRVVFLQPGHGPRAFADASYRRLLGRSLRWAARKDGGPAWVPLFDKKTLDGWVQRGGKAKYRVEDGQIIGSSVPNTGNSFLCTRREYSDFVLELELKVDSGLNSGVQVRSHCFDEARELEWQGKRINVPANRVHGLQVEIDPSSRAWTAGIYEEGARGWLNDLKDNEAARQAFRAGEWNKLRVECRGESIKTWLNGVPAADLKDSRVASGFIGLQVHGVGNSEKVLEVRFRNIRLQEP